MKRSYDVLIIGGGPAAYTAAIYTARAKLNVLVLTGPDGGQLSKTSEVENFPGHLSIMGGDLISAMQTQAKQQGANIMVGVEVVNVAQRESGGFEVTTNDASIPFVLSRTVIVATGANARYLGLPNEERYLYNGLSACAVCDGSLPCYRNGEIFVVGGGDSMAEEALYLARFAKTVTVVVRAEKMRAAKVMQERLRATPNIKFLFNTEIVEYKGEHYLEVVVTKNNKTMETVTRNANGVFMAIGHTPNTSFLKKLPGLTFDREGYLHTFSPWLQSGPVFTAVEGLFAAGDVSDRLYRQAITASAFGCMAALETIKFLEK